MQEGFFLLMTHLNKLPRCGAFASAPNAAINQNQKQQRQDIRPQPPDALTFPVKYQPGVRPRNMCREVSLMCQLASAGSAELMAEFSPPDCGQNLTADLRRGLKPIVRTAWQSVAAPDGSQAQPRRRRTHVTPVPKVTQTNTEPPSPARTEIQPFCWDLRHQSVLEGA